MPAKNATFTHLRPRGQKMTNYNGQRYTIICDCNRPKFAESEEDRIYGSDYMDRDFSKCPTCGYFPWISLAQDRWRTSERYIRPERRTP